MMIHLATLSEGHRIVLPAIANAIKVPRRFLYNILQALSRAELISSDADQSVVLRFSCKAGGHRYEM